MWLISEKDDRGEIRYERNKYGNVIHSKLSNGADGAKFWCKYDKTVNNIIIKFNTGDIFVRKREYYEDGKTLKKVMLYYN